MRKNQDIHSIVRELQTISGIAAGLGEGDVEVYVEKEALKKTFSFLLEKEEVSASETDGFVNRVDGLKERFVGVEDFVKRGDKNAAGVALLKIAKDVTTLAGDLGATEDDKEEPKKKDKEAPKDKGSDAQEEPNDNTKKQGDKEKAPQSPEGGTTPNPSEPTATPESVEVAVSASIFGESTKGDPFGWGGDFLNEIRDISGIRRER